VKNRKDSSTPRRSRTIARSFPVQFIDRFQNTSIPGQVRLSRDEDLLAWAGWKYSASQQDRHWDWWSAYLECKESAGRYECYSALTADRLEGLLVLDLEIRATATGGAITVDYLATNPANRKQDTGLKRVGIALIAVAIKRSLAMGTQGRIWLEALSGAAGFYENLGFEKQASVSADGNATYLLNSRHAKTLLAEIRTKGIVKL
jgi:hypothetical protein